MYSAATRSDLFKHPDIIAKKIIKYPSAYGFVLSGDMKNAAPKFRDYLKVHANDFLKVVGARTKGLVVSSCNYVLINSKITISNIKATLRAYYEDGITATKMV